MAKGKNLPVKRTPVRSTATYKKVEQKLQAAQKAKKNAIEKVKKAEPMNVAMQLGGAAVDGAINAYIPPKYKTIGKTPIPTTMVISGLGIVGSFWIGDAKTANAVRQISSGMMCSQIGRGVESYLIARRTAA